MIQLPSTWFTWPDIVQVSGIKRKLSDGKLSHALCTLNTEYCDGAGVIATPITLPVLLACKWLATHSDSLTV